MMVGRSAAELFKPLPLRTPGSTVMEVKGLSRPRPSPIRAPSCCRTSLALRRGEILGIAGLVGSGRTELARCLFGADPGPPAR